MGRMRFIAGTLVQAGQDVKKNSRALTCGGAENWIYSAAAGA